MKRLFSSRGSNLGQGYGLPCPAVSVLFTQEEVNDAKFIFPTLAQLHVALYGIQTVETNLPEAQKTHKCASGERYEVNEELEYKHAPEIPIVPKTEIALATSMDDGENAGEWVPRPVTLPARRLHPAAFNLDPEVEEVQADQNLSFKEPFWFSPNERLGGVYWEIQQRVEAGADPYTYHPTIQGPIQGFWNGDRYRFPAENELASAFYAAIGFSNPTWDALLISGFRSWTNLTPDNDARGNRNWVHEYSKFVHGVSSVIDKNEFETLPFTDENGAIIAGYDSPNYMQNPTLGFSGAELEWLIYFYGTRNNWPGQVYRNNLPNGDVTKYSYLEADLDRTQDWQPGQPGTQPFWKVKYDRDQNYNLSDPGYDAPYSKNSSVTLRTGQHKVFAFYVDSIEPKNFIGFHLTDRLEPIELIEISASRKDYIPYLEYRYEYSRREDLTVQSELRVWLGKRQDTWYGPGFEYRGELPTYTNQTLHGVDFTTTRNTYYYDAELYPLQEVELVSINGGLEGFTDFTPTLDLPGEVPPA